MTKGRWERTQCIERMYHVWTAPFWAHDRSCQLESEMFFCLLFPLTVSSFFFLCLFLLSIVLFRFLLPLLFFLLLFLPCYLFSGFRYISVSVSSLFFLCFSFSCPLSFFLFWDSFPRFALCNSAKMQFLIRCLFPFPCHLFACFSTSIACSFSSYQFLFIFFSASDSFSSSFSSGSFGSPFSKIEWGSFLH